MYRYQAGRAGGARRTQTLKDRRIAAREGVGKIDADHAIARADDGAPIRARAVISAHIGATDRF